MLSRQDFKQQAIERQKSNIINKLYAARDNGKFHCILTYLPKAKRSELREHGFSVYNFVLFYVVRW